MQNGGKFRAWQEAERAASEAHTLLFEKVCGHSKAAIPRTEFDRLNHLRDEANRLMWDLLAEIHDATAAIRAARRR